MVSKLLIMAWNGIGDGVNDPNQTDPNQMTGVIDKDGYDLVDEDASPDADSDDDGEGSDIDGDNE